VPFVSYPLLGFWNFAYLNLFKLVIEVAARLTIPQEGEYDLPQLGCPLMLATNQFILGSDSLLFDHLHHSDVMVEGVSGLGTGRHHPQPVSYCCYCSSSQNS